MIHAALNTPVLVALLAPMVVTFVIGFLFFVIGNSK